jgi:molecular chaperone HscC
LSEDIARSSEEISRSSEDQGAACGFHVAAGRWPPPPSGVPRIPDAGGIGISARKTKESLGGTVIFGIDLGTTNSLIACLKDGAPAAIPNVHGSVLTPSVVSVDEDGSILVGAVARERLVTKPAHSIASFKRLMGTGQAATLAGRSFRPEDLSALVLRALKADAEHATGEAVEDVIISVPAYFNDAQRKATRLAGQLAGLNVLRLVNEPTAAALFHGIADRDGDNTFLIVDLGGGTFDVSILERFNGVMEVRATGGDSFLGGDDFSAAMVHLLARKAGLAERERDHGPNAAALRFAAESAKRALGQHASCEVDLQAAGLGLIPLALHEFEQACEPLLERLRTPIERALRDARLRAAELDEIVLVGGASRMPMVRRLIAQLFGRLPARHLDPDQTIALGAAVCAGLVARDAAFEEMVLTDVCPHTLGIEVAETDGHGGFNGDVFLPIIERNTVVPASRVKTVQTVRGGQAKLTVEIFQGESRYCSQNIRLGDVTLEIPPLSAGEVKVDVRYTYDVNGILDVDIASEKHGVAHNLVIRKLAGDVSDEDIARRRVELAGLRVHPRDQDENRLVIERASRLYEQLLGDEREALGRRMGQFDALLGRQEPREIAADRAAFLSALDALERGPTW